MKKGKKRGDKLKVRKALIFLSLFILILPAVLAAGEITQKADRLNYWNALNHTVTVTNTGTNGTAVTLSIPSGWSCVSGSGCTCGANIQCNLAGSGSGTYTVQSPGSSASEYDVDTFSPSTNNSYTGNAVKFIRIQDREIFHTLVEYGRGRGNYFFDSAFSGKAGSGHTGAGCSYLPVSTLFELNYLHKVLNIRQYFGDLTAKAYNATFTCTYPNRSIVRQHLITSSVRNSSGAYVSYRIKTIEGSWERMGYLGMDFKAAQQYVGENLAVNCSNITYYLPAGGGNIVVNHDSFSMQVRKREPFIATASAAATIGNGSQEVIITYSITNNESYTADNVIIEIEAPQYATFIGTRAELWGTALDQYRIEKAELRPNETETIILVARFNTSLAPSMTSLNLTKQLKIKYTTCWEINAYNPTQYMQYLQGIGTGTVNMGTPASITNLVKRIIQIKNLTVIINNTVTQINNTVNEIENIVAVINTTTNETNYIVKVINTTTTSILNKTNLIYNNTLVIMNDTATIIDLLNCNGTVDTPLCSKIAVLNNSLYNLWNYTLQLNNTAHNINISIGNINVTGVNVTVQVDFSNLTTLLRDVKRYINCTNITAQPNTSVCNRLDRIENLTLVINNSVENLWNITQYFNTTVFGNLTFQDILDAITNATGDTSDVREALIDLREFQEEVVFLVTDSFGLQQQAQADFSQGNIVSAADNLVMANTKLMKSLDILLKEEAELTGEGTSIAEKGTRTWMWVAVIVALALILVVYYLFSYVPESGESK